MSVLDQIEVLTIYRNLPIAIFALKHFVAEFNPRKDRKGLYISKSTENTELNTRMVLLIQPEARNLLNVFTHYCSRAYSHFFRYLGYGILIYEHIQMLYINHSKTVHSAQNSGLWRR